jgi:hypothetical protein
MKKNLKFKFTIECSKNEKDWNINAYFNSTNIYNEIFFIKNYPILNESDCIFQKFEINDKLKEKIIEILFKSKINYITLSDSKFDQFIHFLIYSKFKNDVYYKQLSNTFFRMTYENTQEKLYKNILKLNKKYLSKFEY